MTALQWGAVSFMSDENSGIQEALRWDTKAGGILIIRWPPSGGATAQI